MNKAHTKNINYPTIEQYIGNTPLVRLQRLVKNPTNTVLVKLEGNNPAGSVKDRPALSMISLAENKGLIKPGDTLIEATSGNTGIALAMAAAIKGYKMILIMPSHMSAERIGSMKAYGAEIILTPAKGSMEAAIDLSRLMEARGEGVVLDQFSNADNPFAHYKGTAPEIWHSTEGQITHFVSSMGTTGTIMGCSKYFKEQVSKGLSDKIQVIGVQPEDGSQIPGIRRWPKEYLPKIYNPENIDLIMDISQQEAEEMTRLLAAKEGIFAGISSGGAVAAALKLSQQVDNATIVSIICDRGDRYLSTGVFPA
ncbi:MAG: cysteine synthase CysM [Pseudomonadota bacterium]